MEKHLTRKQLIEAAKAQTDYYNEHLEKCNECQFLYKIFNKIDAGNQQIFSHAPNNILTRAMLIPERSVLKKKLKKLKAIISFDSWIGQPALKVRNTELNTRRLSITCGDISLDLQASRKRSNWQFIAKINDEVPFKNSYIKTTSEINIYPDEDGFFIWNEKTPPKELSLIVDDKLITIPKLKWKIS